LAAATGVTSNSTGTSQGRPISEPPAASYNVLTNFPLLVNYLCRCLSVYQVLPDKERTIRFSVVTPVGLIFATGLAVAVAQGESRFDQWQSSRPFTIGSMYYAYFRHGPQGWGPPAQLPPPPAARPDMTLFRKAGLNLLNDVSYSNSGPQGYPGISTAQASGVPFMILGAGWAREGVATDEVFNAFANRVRRLADDPRWNGLCGVQLADEPRTAADHQAHRRQRDWLVQTYPHLLVSLCETLTDTPTWTRQYHAMLPDAIFYQWYPYYTDSASSQQIQREMHVLLEMASRFCTRQGIGFFITRGSSSGPWPESVYRLATFSSLAHGVDGFMDWMWDDHSDPATAPEKQLGYASLGSDSTTRPTPAYAGRAVINREAAILGNAILQLKHVQTYHQDISSVSTWAGPIYHFSHRDQLRTGKLTSLVDISLPLGVPVHLLVSFFRDRKDQEYFMVVNKNETRNFRVQPENLSQTITLTFREDVEAIERLNRNTGQVERLELSDENTFQFVLPAGTGDLFKYANGQPFVATVTSQTQHLPK